MSQFEIASATDSLKPAFERKTALLELSAKLTADRLKLFVDCRRPEAASDASPPELRRDDLLALLDTVPQALLHFEVVDDIVRNLNEGKPCERRRVSKGQAPTDGRDGKLLLLVKKYVPWNKTDSLEFVDYRCLRLFDNIEKGTIVARVYPPTPGGAGIDALGGELKPKPGKPLKLAVDSSLSVHEPLGGLSFQTIEANLSGYLVEEGGKLVIRPELVIDTDIGFKTGDIDFIGAVRVRGDVLKDFRIEADGDVTISGSAVNSTAVSHGGAITVGGTAFGASDALIAGADGAHAQAVSRSYIMAGAEFFAATNFKAFTVQGATIESDGDIIIEREASNSLLNARGSLLLSHGHLFGGETRVVCGVEAAKIGTPLMGRTVIHLCSDVESTFDYANLLYRIEQHRNAEQLLALHLGPYVQRPERIRLLKDQYRRKLEQLHAKLGSVQRNLQRLVQRKQELLAGAQQSSVLRVNFHGVLHRGTVIYVGERFFSPEEDITGPKSIEFFADTKLFSVTELRPLRQAEGAQTS